MVASLSPATGGLARAVSLIASSHARAGLEVLVLTTADGAAVEQLTPPVQVHCFPRDRTTRRFAGSRALRRWLRTELRPDDTVHVHAIWDLPAVLAGRHARRVGARTVVSPHGSLEPFDLRKHAVAKRLLGPLLVRPLLADATVHCTAEREARSLVGYGARPGVRVLPLPVEDEPSVGDAGAFREAHDVPPEVPVLLFLGRVDRKKGLAHLLRAVALMRHPAHLVIAGAGDDSLESELRGLAEKLALRHRVTWTGWLHGPAKADAFSAADLFVLLSDAENYGIAAVEAMQHGATVVVSDQVGAAEDPALVGAVLLAPREPAAAAARLDRYLDDLPLREATRRAASRALEERLSPRALDPAYRALATGDLGAVPL